MQLSVITSLTGLVLLACILELLRRHQLKEKYAALWLAVGSAVVPLGMFPQGLDSVAGSVGIKSGVSLVLFAGIVLLLLVCLHLSWESSRLEEETRTLAEQIALLRTELDAVSGPAAPAPPPAEGPGPEPGAGAGAGPAPAPAPAPAPGPAPAPAPAPVSRPERSG